MSTEVTIDVLKQSLLRIFRHNLKSKRYRPTPMIQSAPGIGKSAIMREIAEELNLELVDIRLATKSVLDLAGVPYRFTNPDTGEEETRWARPDFAARDGILLFLDELTSAVPAVQAAAYEIMLDRRVGGHPLPENVVIAAAGNRVQDRGVVYEMPVPLRNRLVHYTLVPDVDSFIRYGMRVGLDESILAFIKFKPDLLHRMPTGNDMSFPTPRSWEFLSTLLQEGIEWHDMAGVIGEGPATEFDAFRRLRSKLPDVEKLLIEGGTFITDELSVLYSYTFSLATNYLRLRNEEGRNRKQQETLLDNFVKLVHVLPEEMLLLAFLLVTDTSNPQTEGMASALYNNKFFMDNCVTKVADVLKG